MERLENREHGKLSSYNVGCRCQDCRAAKAKWRRNYEAGRRFKAPRVHRLSEIDPEARTAVCAHCGPVAIYESGPGGRFWSCREANRAHCAEYRSRQRTPQRYVPGGVSRRSIPRRPAFEQRDQR